MNFQTNQLKAEHHLSGLRGTLCVSPDMAVRFEPDHSIPLKHEERQNPSCTQAIADIRSIVKNRRIRAEVLGEGLFSDPAWDILLDLYLASLMQFKIPVSSVCVGSVPATTVLRWLTILEDRGLLRREDDPFDGRRCLLSLSDSGRNVVDTYFELAVTGPMVI